MTTIITICSPGLIRLSDEQLCSCVWAALRDVLYSPPAVRQNEVDAAKDKPYKLVIVELSDRDTGADLVMIESRLQRLLCPSKLLVEDEDVSVVFV